MSMDGRGIQSNPIQSTGQRRLFSAEDTCRSRIRRRHAEGARRRDHAGLRHHQDAEVEEEGSLRAFGGGADAAGDEHVRCQRRKQPVRLPSDAVRPNVSARTTAWKSGAGDERGERMTAAERQLSRT
eukprot:scaffold155_cov347-Pavlova_lutheri.AAC.55